MNEIGNAARGEDSDATCEALIEILEASNVTQEALNVMLEALAVTLEALNVMSEALNLMPDHLCAILEDLGGTIEVHEIFAAGFHDVLSTGLGILTGARQTQACPGTTRLDARQYRGRSPFYAALALLLLASANAFHLHRF